MCGIAGFVGAGGENDLQRMVDLLAHRGPDGSGTYLCREHNAFIGHRRLAIIDLAGGVQPMVNVNGDTILTFNGEIYNHASLRETLIKRGHKFVSDHSDTEVLLHGWREWEEGLPEKLNGMFAFAIFDRRRRQLFLARDRFGEKPLYWCMQKDTFLFASELTALTGHKAFQGSINQRSLQKYFAYGYIPSPNAVYRDCAKLEPGSQLSFDLASRRVSQRRYWRFRIEPTDRPVSFDEAKEEVRTLFSRAVQRRLMSDVPLGVLLSGGIDSSAVTANVLAHPDISTIKSFCLGFSERSYDESRKASEIADFLGSDHFEFTLSEAEGLAHLPDVLGHLDEPMADPSILPTMYLSRKVREHVTVALTGDGGDELFGGYATFKALKVAAFTNRMFSRKAIRRMARLVDLLPRSSTYMSLDFKLRRALRGVGCPSEFWNPVWMSPLTESDIGDLFNTPVDPEDLYSEAVELWRSSRTTDLVNRSLEFYTNIYLPDDILAKSDRASMRFGLELRSVFLDNDLVDFVRTLPVSHKFHRGQGKRVLKAALAGMIPDSVLNRPKRGFAIPFAKWIRRLPTVTAFADGIGLVGSVAERHARSHLSGATDERLFMWAWLTLQHSPIVAVTPPRTR